MSDNENLDLLDLEDDTDLIDLPLADPFANAPRPKKPWMLLGIALVVIILATYIIIRVIGSDKTNSVDINLDRPVVVNVNGEPVNPAARPDQFENGADRLIIPNDAPPPQPAAVITPAERAPVGTPTRVVDDRAVVTFDPDRPVVAPPKPRPATRPATTTTPAKPKAATTTKPAAAKPATGTWYVQFGSYSSRALAEAGQKKIMAQHPSLLGGKQFVILAAEVNGKTLYRLRMTFPSSAAANGFCNNAKSDGLDCYVTK